MMDVMSVFLIGGMGSIGFLCYVIYNQVWDTLGENR